MVEIIFLMLVLKLPLVYLVAVVWWAVRAEPHPPEPAVLPVPAEPGPSAGPLRPRIRGPRRGGPRDQRRPVRRPERVAAR